MSTADLKSDIPFDLAQHAHAGTSFVPETRAAGEQSGYAAGLLKHYESFKAHALKGGTLAQLDEEFIRFRAGMRRHTLAYLHSKTRFVSAWIVGPSRYPAARMQKRHGVIERRLEELLAFEKRAARAVIRKLRPDLGPIMAGDADALERLEAELREAERAQERKKAANAAIRKNAKAGREAQTFALAALGFSPATADELLQTGNWWGQGFPGFHLTNKAANIRRLKNRIIQVQALCSREAKSTESSSGIRLEEAPSENRVRLFFPGKPSAEVITSLKRSGFRWTPSLGCWQAYYSALQKAKAFAEAA